MKQHFCLSKIMVASVLLVLLGGCKTMATKDDVYDNRSPSYLVYGYNLHLQGDQAFQKEWMDEHQFAQRVKQHYDPAKRALRLPFNPKMVAGSFYAVVSAYAGIGKGQCHQMDASYETDGLHVMVECIGEGGFIPQELLLNIENNQVSLIDIRSAANGIWLSEVMSLFLNDGMGVARINDTFTFIGETREKGLDLNKYYQFNGYIKTNQTLAMTFNSVHDNANIRKEISLALEKMCPDDPDCALSRLDYYLESQQYGKAIDALNLAKTRYPRSQFIQETLSNLYLETKQDALAVEAGRELIWVKPSSINGFMQVFTAAASLGDVEQATQAAATMIKGFQVQPQDITNEYNQSMTEIPGFWQRVNDMVAASNLRK